MIVKLSLANVDFLLTNIKSLVDFWHKSNLILFQNQQDISESDSVTTQLMLLYFNLKSIKQVEETKRNDTKLRMDYLQARRQMLYDFLAIGKDTALEDAISQIQSDLADLNNAMQYDCPFDVDIDSTLYAVLKQHKLIN